jgi:hypothetical protein
MDIPARERMRRASECALLGVLWLVFSLPVVTSGAAWLAVARVCTAWADDVEPPLLRTFVDTIRRRWLTGLALQAVAIGVAAVPYLDLRFALAAHLPGARLEAAALAVLAVFGLGSALLAVPAAGAGAGPSSTAGAGAGPSSTAGAGAGPSGTAGAGAGPSGTAGAGAGPSGTAGAGAGPGGTAGELGAVRALRAAVLATRAAPWAAPAAVGALAGGAAIVYLLPVLAVVMAGPVGFAVSAIWVRAVRPVG